jgi:hypothetical protein
MIIIISSSSRHEIIIMTIGLGGRDSGTHQHCRVDKAGRGAALGICKCHHPLVSTVIVSIVTNISIVNVIITLGFGGGDRGTHQHRRVDKAGRGAAQASVVTA